MASMDAFNAAPFQMTSMLAPVNEMEFEPTFLEDLNIFESNPVSTTSVAIDKINDVLELVPTSPRGAPVDRRAAQRRTAISMNTVRIAVGDTIYAEQIQNVRAFGTENELESLQRVVANCQQKLNRNIRLTWENMRYGAVNGVLLDADGSTIVDWYDAFDITRPAAVDFDLDNATPASGVLRQACQDVIRAIMRGLKLPVNTPMPRMRVIALCDDTFFDAIIAHPEYRATYLNASGNAVLRESTVFGAINFGGIEFHNVRGTDDGTTVGVGAGEALFFPVIPGMFEVAWSPGEFFDVVNTPGMPVYPLIVPDQKRNAFVEVELYSYPLFICRRPRALQRGVLT